MHSAAVGRSASDGEDGEVKCLPGKVCRGRNYPIPHENQQSSLAVAAAMPSITQSAAAVVGSIQSYAKKKTLTMTPAKAGNLYQNADT